MHDTRPLKALKSYEAAGLKKTSSPALKGVSRFFKSFIKKPIHSLIFHRRKLNLKVLRKMSLVETNEVKASELLMLKLCNWKVSKFQVVLPWAGRIYVACFPFSALWAHGFCVHFSELERNPVQETLGVIVFSLSYAQSSGFRIISSRKSCSGPGYLGQEQDQSEKMSQLVSCKWRRVLMNPGSKQEAPWSGLRIAVKSRGEWKSFDDSQQQYGGSPVIQSKWTKIISEQCRA